MVVNPADWAEQVAVYPLIQGEALWAVESLVVYARELERKNEELTFLLESLRDSCGYSEEIQNKRIRPNASLHRSLRVRQQEA